ncbi:NAD(P)H-binding protein [Thalassomonas actiniarum]|uniref:NAD(P)H-binding protein n=1 Tax=Thalassomonas actiniarum TaxID=485447 RepID=A0AAE9YU25_9GAMM|nr:NAD(P)H-binding protein [Thalassomonas actiniarum]WDE01225.1 NAD(P)H-binding protein [Thalassomonas actiniarum]
MTSAMILGASGLTGQALLAELIADEEIRQITLLVRKPLTISHPKVTQHQIDFGAIDQYHELFAVERIFCCLGTTIKTAGSKAVFQAVDVHLVRQCAQLAANARANKFIVISSVGANSESANFYSRCKGQMEKSLKDICQASAMALVICRPSLLRGQRDSFRLGESVAAGLTKYLNFLFIGPLQQYQPIAAKQLAKAMLSISRQENNQQITTLPCHELIRLAQNEG